MHRSQSNPHYAPFPEGTTGSRILLLALLILLPASSLYASTQEQTSSLRQSVFALDSARKTALAEVENEPLPRSELDDYQDFIVYLNTRIVSYCMEIAGLEDPVALEGLPCPAAPMLGETKGEQSPTEEEFIHNSLPAAASTQTQAEKAKAMDGDFLSSLSQFDELILREEESLSARVPSQRESGTAGGKGSSGRSGSANASGESGDGDQGEATTSTGEGNEPSGSAQEGQDQRSGGSASEQREGGGADSRIDPSAYGVPGGKLPPPKDDDIVARQLREAAEKETDPELKKKLWEEYWKYKGVKKGG